MGSRQDLHNELCAILGSNHVYFQPPETVKLQFPCIIYSLDSLSSRYANNKTFTIDKSYTVTYVTREAVTDIPENICKHFEKCRHTRRYIADNLYHDSFTIYY